MLKKIRGFRETEEARKFMLAIENRVKGAALFPSPSLTKSPAPTAPSL